VKTLYEALVADLGIDWREEFPNIARYVDTTKTAPEAEAAEAAVPCQEPTEYLIDCDPGQVSGEYSTLPVRGGGNADDQPTHCCAACDYWGEMRI
jgi:hypothetical protein